MIADRRSAAWPVLLALVLSAGCGQRRVALPTDAGAPFPDYQQVFDRVSAACRGVRTLRAVLSLSGRAGDERLRGTVHAGFARPDSLRLELRAGVFGTPYFVLAGRDGEAVLWLPRDERVVRGPADAIVEALTGLSLGAADLQAVLTGCVVAEPRAADGRLHGDGWASIALADGATVYLQKAGDAWQVRAAVRGALRVEYPEWRREAQFPARVRLLSETPPVDLRASLSDLAANVDLEPSVFTLDAIPAGTRPMTLDELRASGSLTEP